MATPPPITTLRIQGFKSLVDVQLQPRRLNLFIGKPNVGKSNILEALSLLGAGYSRGEKFMGEFIRYEKANQLFVDGVVAQPISVETNAGVAWLWPMKTPGVVGVAIGSAEFVEYAVASPNSTGAYNHYNMNRGQGNEESPSSVPVSICSGVLTLKAGSLDGSAFTYAHSVVRKYTFSSSAPHSRLEFGHLTVPHGENLFQVIRASKRLRQEIAALFEPNKQQFVLEMGDDTLKTQKNIDGDVYSYPYSLIADTFQRLIFYLAAIESNAGSVLLFEEPEVSSFPEYIVQLAERIAEDVEAGRNQYFITAHSPYLLSKLLEKTAIADTAVFVVDYADYHTIVRALTDDEVDHLLEHGSSLFWNLPDVTPAPAPTNGDAR